MNYEGVDVTVGKGFSWKGIWDLKDCSRETLPDGGSLASKRVREDRTAGAHREKLRWQWGRPSLGAGVGTWSHPGVLSLF